MFLGVVALRAASFGEGTGRIWLDNVKCTGNERQLRNCTNTSFGVNSCSHAQDAGVRCRIGTVFIISYNLFMTNPGTQSSLVWHG